VGSLRASRAAGDVNFQYPAHGLSEYDTLLLGYWVC